MRSTLMEISPKQAKAWLTSNNPLNRNIRFRVVDRYASDMRAGSWHETHQGIAFYDDGSLADGQHRLAAIVSSGVPVRMLVTFDIPKTSARALDLHAQRQAHDALRIAGAAPWLTKDAIATIRQLAEGMGVTQLQLSPDQIEAYGKEFEEHIRFVEALFVTKRKNVTSAIIRACCVAALLAGEQQDDIRRFARVLISGEMSEPNENAAIRLREFLLSSPAALLGGYRVGTGKRIQRAIRLFCEGKSIHKLFEPTDWIYPCPAAGSVLPGLITTHPTKRKNSAKNTDEGVCT